MPAGVKKNLHPMPPRLGPALLTRAIAQYSVNRLLGWPRRWAKTVGQAMKGPLRHAAIVPDTCVVASGGV